MIILGNFKKLPKGLKRTIIAGTIFVPFIISYLLLLFFNNRPKYTPDADDIIPAGFILGIPIYWILVLIFSWVYNGFNEK